MNPAREAAISAAVCRISANVGAVGAGFNCEVDEAKLKEAVTVSIDALMAKFSTLDMLRRVTPDAEKVFELLDAQSKAHIEAMAFMFLSDLVYKDFVEQVTTQIASRSTLQ